MPPTARDEVLAEVEAEARRQAEQYREGAAPPARTVLSWLADWCAKRITPVACLLMLVACGGGHASPPSVAPSSPLPDGYAPEFYAMFALGKGTLANGQDGPWPLRRHQTAPALYVNTHDVDGVPVPSRSVETAAHGWAVILPLFTGWQPPLIAYGPPPEGAPNAIEIKWSTRTDTSNVCGQGLYGGQTLTLYHGVPQCLCDGVISMFVVKHELGHTLGFYHTDDPNDLMAGMSRPAGTCDMDPSPREVVHARLAYSRPVWSLMP